MGAQRLIEPPTRSGRSARILRVRARSSGDADTGRAYGNAASLAPRSVSLGSLAHSFFNFPGDESSLCRRGAQKVDEFERGQFQTPACGKRRFHAATSTGSRKPPVSALIRRARSSRSRTLTAFSA